MWCSGKELPANAGDSRDVSSIPQLRRLPWRRKWQPIPVFLPGKFHGQMNLEGSSPWGRKESNMTEWLSPHRGVEKKTGVGWRDLGAPVTTTRVSKSFQEAPTPLLIGPIHVLYLLKSGSVFIYLSIFTKRKIELQNGSNSTLQLLSVNGSRPQMAPHLEQALHTRTRLTRLSMLLKQLMYSQSMVYVFYNYTRGKHSLWK